jgi:hypothetical protein
MRIIGIITAILETALGSGRVMAEPIPSNITYSLLGGNISPNFANLGAFTFQSCLPDYLTDQGQVARVFFPPYSNGPIVYTDPNWLTGYCERQGCAGPTEARYVRTCSVWTGTVGVGLRAFTSSECAASVIVFQG